MSTHPSDLLMERTQRIQDAILLKRTDRVPFAPFLTFFPAKYTAYPSQRHA